jgi:hypothetical protein
MKNRDFTNYDPAMSRSLFLLWQGRTSPLEPSF